METKSKINQNSSGWALKIILIVVSALLLLIPLAMVRGLIDEREGTKNRVEDEVAKSYGDRQRVDAPAILSTVVVKQATGNTPKETEAIAVYPIDLDYKADVATDVLHRSIYDIVVYSSTIEVSGKFLVRELTLNALENKLSLAISDFKGLSEMPRMAIGGRNVSFERVEQKLLADFELPEESKAGDEIPFEMTIKLRGTGELMFSPLGDETSLTVESSYPHPSFQGEFLPETRDVREDGFSATWNVLKINMSNLRDVMGVEFVTPANPYQQAERSAKYGILIIALVFAAGLLVEFLTRKRIHGIQYIIIGLSLVLFYALLLSFSEFMAFGLAYLVAAAMTTCALMLYFRGILKSRLGYLLGLLISLMYAANYILLQMETFGILSGSLLLFAVLSVLMYFTANINESNEAE